FQQIATITRNTFTESIRQPIYIVMIGVGAALLIFNVTISAYSLDDDDKLMIEMGLSTVFLGGLFLAAFTATGVLAREIENKTVLTVISKPMSRPAFILGKYLGVLGAVAMAYWTWTVIFLMTVRHNVMQAASDHLDWPVIVAGFGAVALSLAIATWGNYFYNWVFTSRFCGFLAVALGLAYLFVLLVDKEWNLQPFGTEFNADGRRLVQIILAMGLLFQSMIVICAIAIACSTRLGQVMTLLICLSFFMLGITSDYFFGQHLEAQPLAWIGYALAPNIQFVWLADALVLKHEINAVYLGQVTAYIGLYTAAVLCLASALFQTCETG
ncbi:MAG: ABC transporter permease, partial [Planctomycetota bacterium]